MATLYSMEAGVDGWVTLTLIPPVTRLKCIVRVLSLFFGKHRGSDMARIGLTGPRWAPLTIQSGDGADLCVFVVLRTVCRTKFLLHPFLYLLVAELVRLALDLEDYHPSVLLHCWLGHLTCKIVSEMTYNVSSGTLNPTIPYYRTRLTASARRSVPHRTCMTVLVILGRKCTLAASCGAPGESRWVYDCDTHLWRLEKDGTDRQTDRRKKPDRYITLTARLGPRISALFKESSSNQLWLIQVNEIFHWYATTAELFVHYITRK